MANWAHQQVERGTLLGTLKDTQSLTPVTQVTGYLEIQPEHVSLTEYGLGVYHHVFVSEEHACDSLVVVILLGSNCQCSNELLKNSPPQSNIIYTCIGDCGNPGSTTNGGHNISGTTHGHNITYSCDTGYRLTAGSSTRRCQPNGEWSGNHPICSRKFKSSMK